MAKNHLSVTGTGDSLFTARFPEEYRKDSEPVREFIKSCDVRITNLETNLSDFDSFGGAYSGGTWINTPVAYAQDLFGLGFNCYGTANNHVMDYSYGGLLSTIDVLDKNGKAHSGTGRSLEEAAKPAILEEKGQKIAIFAVDSSLNDASRAGRATHHIKARPGVNFLRHDTAYSITKEEEAVLRQIADRNGINFSRQMSISTGFLTPDPEGFYFHGTQKYTTKQGVPKTSCNKKDKERLVSAVKEAKKNCDYVFLLVHCHDNDGKLAENPPEYLKEFAHACIDAGCSAIFGGGCHSLRGIEFYKGFPIFYSLGDFIYQGLTVDYLPADFMEKYDTDIFCTAKEALNVRSRGGKVGLSCHLKNFQTILPKLEYEDGKLVSCKMLPLQLVFERKDAMNGLPQKATDTEADAILKILQTLSAQFGTKLKMSDGLIVPE